MIRRRQFLEGCGYGLAGLLGAHRGVPCLRASAALAPRELAADVVILGGGVGGWRRHSGPFATALPSF